MMSAIAARKAAQSVKTESLPVAPTSPIPDSPAKSTRRTSKRKPSEQAPSLPKKRRRNVRGVHVKSSRYFDEKDAFLEQDDLIVVDSDESEGSSEEMNSDSPPLLGDLRPAVSRGWSPSAPLYDSSDDEGPPHANGPAAKSAGSSSILEQMSTFQPILDQNLVYLTSEEMTALHLNASSTSPAALLSMSPTERICLLGVYSLTVLRGTISMCGVTMSASPRAHRVFAPKSSPVPVLEAQSESGSFSSVAAIPARLQPFFLTDNVIVVVQELRTNVEDLGLVCRTFDNIFEPSRDRSKNTAFDLDLSGVHMLAHGGKDVHAFTISSSWGQALLAVASESTTTGGIYMVKGPKRSGKSSFARTLLNSLLNRYQKVAYLECDLGQSEFTPGGMVGLNVIESPIFGPAFTHPTIPNFAHYIGATSPQASPSQYLSAVQSLVQLYRLDVQSPYNAYAEVEDGRISEYIPLVVNTMGWTKGLGADLMNKIEDMVTPTHVFQFEQPVYESAWPTTQAPSTSHPVHGSDVKIHTLQPVPISLLSSNYSAADHRTLSILSYFHAVFSSSPPTELTQSSAEMWNVSLPLCAQPPYEVEFASAIERVVVTGAGSEDVHSSEIHRVLNGAVVGLVSCEPGTLDIEAIPSENATSPTSRIPYTQGSSVPSPATSGCHGLALVRSVSPDGSHMHLLTPLPPSLLSKTRVVVKGELELPIWGMLDFRAENDEVAGVEKGKVPYLQWGKGEGLGGEKRRVRRNLMRKGQM